MQELYQEYQEYQEYQKYQKYQKYEKMGLLDEESSENLSIRAKRSHQARIIEKRNAFRIKTEPYMGLENRPMSMCSLVPSGFKRQRRRQRRAKEKQALRSDRLIPLFKKDDLWDWW